MTMGTVYWDEHALCASAPSGHMMSPGSGELLGFATDSHGAACGVVEADGGFWMIRLEELSRIAPVRAEEPESKGEQAT